MKTEAQNINTAYQNHSSLERRILAFVFTIEVFKTHTFPSHGSNTGTDNQHTEEFHTAVLL
jgi:hypothetical protein